MPPIRTFKSAPINPHSAANNPTSASETQEQQPPQQDQDAISGERKETEAPAWTPATPTAGSIADRNNYPAARPGAPAMPAPTGSIYTPTRTYPTSTTSTTSTDSTSSPPPPQPASRPAPPLSSASPSRTPTGPSTIPPPPKVGEAVQPASYYTPSQVSPQQQQQQTIPNSTSTPYLSTYQPPTAATSPYRSTSTYVAGSAPGLPLSQPEQSNTSSIFETFGGGEGTGQDILNTARSWMASAGSKLAEAEEEVWRMVNKK